jgi:hypothetical protein
LTNGAQEGTPEFTPANEVRIAEEAAAASSQEQEQAQESSDLLNKYGYSEFAGYSGKRHLDTILQQILSYATWRTWHFSDEFVAPAGDCYVGPYKLSGRIKPGIRKIEMDFKALRERGLMRVYPDYRLVKQSASGQVQMQAVIIKDFSPLYELAHEYHLWLNSPHYIPPEREYVPLILADEELTQKLLRFDNYRRILCCKKPGRKPQQAEAQPISHADLVAIAAESAQNTVTYINPKTFTNTEEKTFSANRRSKNSLIEPFRVSTSNSLKEEGLAPTTIRRVEPRYLPEQGTEEIVTTEQYLPSKSNSTPLPINEPPAEAVKEVKNDNSGEKQMSAQEKAAAVLSHIIPPEHWQEMKQTRQAAAASRALAQSKEQRVRWHAPDWLVREVARQAQDLQDDPKVLGSVLTRWTKAVRTVFEVAEIQREEIGDAEAELIINKIKWSRKRLNRYIRKINPKRRVPYMLECFLNSWHLTPAELLYFESEEPLYQDSRISDFVARLYQSYERSGSRVEFDQWAAAKLEQERARKKQQRS